MKTTTMKQRLILAAALLASGPRARAFVAPPSPPARSGGANVLRAQATSEAGGTSPDDSPPRDDAAAVEAEAADLKRRLYQLAASFDRGFGATPKARDEVDGIIRRLREINPTENAARGIDGDGEEVPLRAIWRMVWTTAFDVVSLGASPFAAPSAIYQDISDPPVATNIIDFIPRAQTFLPASVSPPSLLRAEVTTRASSRRGMPDRVGLIFEGVKLQPIELLGQKVDNLPPLTVDFLGPRNFLGQLAESIPGMDLESLGLTGDGKDVDPDTLGYFEVDYLDDELLIIRQNDPGGVFALAKVDSSEP